MKKLYYLVAIFGFLLCRPYALQQSGMMYNGDDYNYLAHATVLAYGQWPDYSLEANSSWPPFHSYGAGLMAAPFVLVTSFVDRILGKEVARQRTPSNVPHSWTAFGFVIATQFYLCLGMYWLVSVLRKHLKSSHALPSVALAILGSGILLYAYRRPVFAHVYEFAVLSGGMYFLNSARVLDSKRTAAVIIATLVACMIYLVRYNDAFLALAFLLAAIMQMRPSRLSIFFSLLTLGIIFVTPTYLNTYILKDMKQTMHALQPAVANSTDPYSTVLSFLTAVQSPAFYYQRLIHILFGLDWGLLYTAPILMLGFLGLPYLKPLKTYVLLLGALGVNVYICMVWGTQGSWYGYRYLVYSLLPVSTLGLSLWWDQHKERTTKIILCLVSIVPILSMLSFEGNPTNLTLSIGTTRWSSGWVNNTFQLEVWKTLLLHPKEMFVVLFKGGPLYVVYIASVFLHKTSYLPHDVMQKYPMFSLSVFLKMLIIWFLPIVFVETIERVKSRT